MKSIYRFFVSVFEAIIEARRLQAQYSTKNHFGNYL